MKKRETFEYRDGDVLLQGTIVRPNHDVDKKPVVIIAHDWSGKNDFACEKADLLAELGYIGFALDMYGNGKTGTTKEEKIALMSPLMQDRSKLQQRILSAFHAAQTLKDADPDKIAAIGFCFGGLCALDLARTGAKAKGVVSFHGLLDAPQHSHTKSISAKVLALHGYNDPMATPDQAITFANEMTAAKADWQMHMYGNTVHAFMNPLANDPDMGLIYNPVTAARAWRLMEDFLHEIFLDQ